MQLGYGNSLIGQNRPRGAAFDVLSLSPAIWLDANQEAYVNNDPVTTATDFSGNSRDFTEATNPPTFKTGVLNGKPGFYFDGTEQLLRSYTGTGTDFSIFLICNRSDDSFRTLWTNSIDPYFGLNTGRRAKFYQGSSLDASYSGLPADIDEPVVLGVISNNGTTRLLIGKNEFARGATTASALKVSGLSNLGGYKWVGHLFEGIATESAVSDADVINLCNYAKTKWSVPDRRILVMDGDSITYGSGASDLAHSWAGLLATSLGTTNWHTINTGISGQTIADQTAGGGPAEWMSLAAATNEFTVGRRMQSSNVLIAWGGSNDLFYGASAASAYAALVDYCTAAQSAGFSVIVATMLDRATAGGSWTRAAMQTFNASVRANWATFADALVDPVTENSNFDDNTSGVFAEKIHPNDTGHALLSAMFSTAIASL